MKNIKKYLFITAELLLIVVFAMFCYFNVNTNVDIYCKILNKTFNTKLIYHSIFIIMLGHIGGWAITSFFHTKVSDLCNAYQKRHENNAIESDNDKARIKVLEGKIATLEAALESALKNK